MERSKAARSWMWGLFLLGQYSVACSDPAEVLVEMPFDPTGTWDAVAQGTLRGSAFSGPLVIQLETFGEPFQSPGAPYLLVELRGVWKWGDVTGSVEGFWDTPARPDQPPSGCAGGILAQCSLRLALEAPGSDYCARPSDIAPYVPIIVYGWFEDADLLVAPHIRGAYWEGLPTDPWPCTQPVLVGFDTSGDLRRQ